MRKHVAYSPAGHTLLDADQYTGTPNTNTVRREKYYNALNLHDIYKSKYPALFSLRKARENLIYKRKRTDPSRSICLSLSYLFYKLC